VTVDFDRDSIASSNGTLALELTAERREDERLCRAPRLPPASMLCGMRALTYFVEVDSASCGIQLFDDACRAYFRNRLFESIKRHSSQLHAYALLADHAWLLVSAFAGAVAVFAFIQPCVEWRERGLFASAIGILSKGHLRLVRVSYWAISNGRVTPRTPLAKQVAGSSGTAASNH
jgi:hypothetical protein